MTPRPPHLIEPVSGAAHLRSIVYTDYIPTKLWGEGPHTPENEPGRSALTQNNPLIRADRMKGRATITILAERDHAIRFRDMWVTPQQHEGFAVEGADESTLKASITFELQQDAADSTRPWRAIPIATVGDDGFYSGVYELKTAADARAFLDAWSERELREHAVMSKAQRISIGVIEGAYTLTTEANAAREAGNTALETEKADAWLASRDAMDAITEDVLLKWLYDDPNLLVSVVPTDGQALAADGAVTIHATRKRWTIPVRATGEGRIRFRNIVKDYVGLAADKWRMGSMTDTATGKALTLNLEEDVPVGTYTLWIDLMATGNPDPVAELSVEIAVPGTAVTANAGRGHGVASGGTIQIGGADTVQYPVGETTIAWTRTSGEGGSLDDTTIARPTFTAPTVTEPRTIVWRKTVTNNSVSALDEVSVTVSP